MLSSSRFPHTMLSSSRFPHTMLSSSMLRPRRPEPQTMLLPHTMLSSSSNLLPQTMLSSSRRLPHTMLSSSASESPQTMLLPQTMLSSSSKELPQTMLSSSPKLFPHTMLSSSLPRPSPQMMLRPHAGRCSVINCSPTTRRAPQMIDCDQAYDWLPMVVEGVSVVDSQGVPTGACGLIARASATDPVTSIWPAPCASGSNRLPSSSSTGIEVYSRTAFTAFGVRSRLACSTSATTPLATPAAMLVPERRM